LCIRKFYFYPWTCLLASLKERKVKYLCMSKLLMSANDRLQFLGLLLHLFVLFSSYRLVVYHFDSKWDDIFYLQAYIIFYLTLLKFVSLLCRNRDKSGKCPQQIEGGSRRQFLQIPLTEEAWRHPNKDGMLFSFHYRHIDADSINREIGEDRFFT
jgi:hypothetical protein